MSEDQTNQRFEIDTRVELTRLWLKHLPALEVFVSGAVSDRHAREDIIQSTAEQVSRNFDQYDRSRPFNAWVIGIAKYGVLAYYRARQRDRLVFGELELDLLSNAAEKVSEDVDARMAALDKCMSKLSVNHKELMRWRYVEGVKTGAIAQKIGANPNTVSATLRRVRLALAECIRRQLGSSAGR